MSARITLSAALALASVTLAASPALAQRATQAPAAPKPEMTESCPGLVAHNSPRIRAASFQLAALAADEVRLNYIGHSTFLIESPRLVRIATDYNDYVRPPIVPDVATMNHAHTTHYTDRPDPAIKYILRGWAQIEESWRRIFGGPGRNQFIVTNEVVAAAGDVAWVTLDENLVDQFATGTVAATNTFVRTPDGWRMVLHHGSPVRDA